VKTNDSSHASFFLTISATVIAFICGAWVFLISTDQGQALTTESLRQAELNDHPKLIPNFSFLDDQGAEIDLYTRLGSEDRVMLVDFVYTRCQTVCLAQGSSFQNLQQQIKDLGLSKNIGLLSISFDPEHDDSQSLARYAQRLKMDPKVWQIFSLKTPRDRQELLDTFGIMVIPAPLDEFEHNAAYHVVYRKHLYKIVEITRPQEAIDYAVFLQEQVPSQPLKNRQSIDQSKPIDSIIKLTGRVVATTY
jgi:protein SCO1